MILSETELAVLVVLCPFVAAAALGLCPPLRRSGGGAAVVSLVGSGLALVGSVRLVTGLWRAVERAEAWKLTRGFAPAREIELTVAWLPRTGEAPLATIGVLVDPLSAMMATLVALVAFLVQLYSLGYLDSERPPSLGRYYLYQSLFAFSMLGLVFAPNFLQMFVFWELVGLCSYLLIGFYYDRPAAARAAVKAFWVTKLGDVGFVLGIVLLWGATGEFGFEAIERALGRGALTGSGLFVVMGLVYLGAAGKSAQFPLHVWLPDAMEGPTPVSALIHAATMVTAGVYLVARAYPLFLAAPEVLTLIGWIGALTALLAAILALVQTDIKRVLAYSTVSQLGYMMAALGAGTAAAAAAGFLHLLTHGFFKALLFLAAGAVIHAVGTNDMRQMGGLARRMPATTVVFLIGTAALAGLPPLSGFVSKEAVLAAVWAGPGLRLPFVMLALTVALTALYMGRAVILTFFGPQAAGGHPHDPPPVMAGPLWVLAIGTVAAGLIASERLPLSFAQFLLGSLDGALPHGAGWLMPASIGLAVLGLAAAWLGYQRRGAAGDAPAGAAAPLARAAAGGFGLDALYQALYGGALLGLARAVGSVDRYLVDGIVNAASAGIFRLGAWLRRVQSGRAQDYLYGIAAGLLLLFFVWSRA
jgi:NADH-quinone oxidoreductase subunit L